MRAAGADAELAARVAAARDRLLARRYGPTAGLAGDPALAGEVEGAGQRLGGTLRGGVSRRRGAPARSWPLRRQTAAQAPSPETLYEHGSLSAAAGGLCPARRGRAGGPAHWYNLGAAYYRLGSPGRASAAWLEAAPAAPRKPRSARRSRLVPPADATSSRWAWIPAGHAGGAAAARHAGLARGLGRMGAPAPACGSAGRSLLVFGAIAIGAGLGLRAWYRRPIAVVLDRSTLRLSPHGLAPALVLPLEGGSMVRVLRRTPGWLLVHAPGGRRAGSRTRRSRRWAARFSR